MHFITDTAWEETNPVFKVFDHPEHPRRRWKAVELPLSVHYYLAHVPIETEEGTMQNDLLFADLFDVLGVLKTYAGSTLHILVPEWDNDGEVTICHVNHIFKTVESKVHIAECSNGKSHILSSFIEQEDINLNEIVKEIVWSNPDCI